MSVKKILGVFLIGILFSITGIFTASAKSEEVALCQGSTSAILFERSTNTVLYNKEMNLRLPPASMTKIMTLLLIYEALDSEQITKTTMLTIGEEPTKVEGSKAFLSIGEEISVDELLKCICIASANDAAIAMAIELAGSEAQFVNKMNEKATVLGLKNTHFSDCTGLSSKNHYTSAYDLAVISDYLLDHYPDVLNYTNLQEDYIRKNTAKPFWLVNTNKMIGRVKYLDGLKTGYTSFSKYCITLHMTQENMSLISVVFGYEKATTRNAESLELLRYGFANYKLEKLASKGMVLESFEHILYKDKVDMIVDEDLYYLCKKNETVNYETKYSYSLGGNFAGKYEVYLDGKLVGESPIRAKEEVRRKNIFELLFSVIRECLN